MILHHRRTRPVSWADRKSSTRHSWLIPILAFDFAWEWLAYLLSNWSFLEVLEYLGSFSVLIGVIFWFSESGARVDQQAGDAGALGGVGGARRPGHRRFEVRRLLERAQWNRLQRRPLLRRGLR